MFDGAVEIVYWPFTKPCPP